jgi:hypothetical protein
LVTLIVDDVGELLALARTPQAPKKLLYLVSLGKILRVHALASSPLRLLVKPKLWLLYVSITVGGGDEPTMNRWKVNGLDLDIERFDLREPTDTLLGRNQTDSFCRNLLP